MVVWTKKNNGIEKNKMCRYGFKNYKMTYACFKCQVGFKRRNLYDTQPEVFDKVNAEAQKENKSAFVIINEIKDFVCPNCGGEMANLGRDLKLPPKSKDEQWEAIKYLYEHQFNFFTCGCNGIGIVPQKRADAVELVEAQRVKSEGERFLERLQKH
jgi:hypothetical protein